jgi:hypothetical protein
VSGQQQTPVADDGSPMVTDVIVGELHVAADRLEALARWRITDPDEFLIGVEWDAPVAAAFLRVLLGATAPLAALLRAQASQWESMGKWWVDGPPDQAEELLAVARAICSAQMAGSPLIGTSGRGWTSAYPAEEATRG